MTTIAEIEAAVRHLSSHEQEPLLARLQGGIRERTETVAADRAAWMRRLDGLRESLGKAAPTLPVETILNDIREG